MSLTILNVLENSYYNIKHGRSSQLGAGVHQLKNAITLLSAGKSVDDDFDDEELHDAERGKVWRDES